MGRMAVQGAGEREEEDSTDMLKVNVDGMAPPRVVGRDAAENFYFASNLQADANGVSSRVDGRQLQATPNGLSSHLTCFTAPWS